PRVVALRHEWQDNSVVAVADLCVEVYFSDYNAAINFTQHEKRVTEVFLPEKVAEGMAIYASCDLHMQDMSLSGDTLTVNLRMDFKLEGVITDVIPGEGVHKELFHIESCIEEKSMAFVEKFEINTDFPISHVESVKGEVASIQVTVMDSKVLIQCNISVHVFYAGPDGVLRSKKALFPFGVFEDLKEGGPEMQVKVISRISEVKTELVALQRLRIIFMLNFDLLATREEDIYLVTQVPKENGKMRQVFYEDHKFNLNFVLPLTSPLLMVKELEAVPRKAWMEKSSSGFWAVGELSVSCSYVGKNHLIHQDFERLDFRFKIPDKEEIAPNNFSVHAKARKIVSNPESDMVEVDLEVEIRTFHFAKI
ncbi:MAG: DUF3794 domain-containing protein, partial [Tepidanaerobacteraceae bacterium]